jgi:tetratricopeptide (TPR) repeat protein/predicted Ser/Thr protein kinase
VQPRRVGTVLGEVEERCADSEVVAAWISGRLEPAAAHALEAHADRCEACLQVLAAVGKICADPHSQALRHSHGAPALADWAMLVASPSLAAPLAGDRYALCGILGKGGFGVVYDARDRELDRPVAIKALAAGHDGAALRREARALAALSHPNVVQVYDVIESQGRVFLVMEQVRGETLRAWQRRNPAGPRILVHYLAAAAGLVAIHRAGLVHADIKPENILLAEDGRVLVADFGLSRRGPEAATEGIAGTPRYMAPEQARGQRLDASADQYSFCVALHEALHGALPGKTPLWTSPRRVREVLRRGMHDDPNARWPDMAALVQALRDAWEPRVQWWPAVVVFGVAIAVAAWASSPSSAAERADLAADAESIDRPAPATEASPAIERAVAQRNAGDLVDALATLGAVVRGEVPSSPLLQTRARHELGRTLDQMANAESRQLFVDAHEGALTQHADLLAAMVAIDLAESEAETPATLEAARMWLRTAEAELRRIDIDPRRHGEFVAAAAQIDAIAGDEAGAAAGFERASNLLLEMDPVARVRTHTRWASMLGRLGEHDRALVKLDEAEAMCRLAELDHGTARIEIHRTKATVLQHLGRFDAAVAEIDGALALAAAIDGYPNAGLAALHGDMGSFHLQRGDADGSARHLTRALELAPDSWVAHNNLSLHYAKIACRDDVPTPGCDPEAGELGYAHQLRSVELAREAFGEDHPTFATMRANLARDLVARGELERARDLFERSCEQLAAHFGPEARQLLNPLYGLVETNVRLGRRDAAVAAARRLHAVAHGPALATRKNATAVLDYVVGRTLAWRSPRDREALRLRDGGRAFFGDAVPDDFRVIDAWFGERAGGDGE